MPRPRRPFTDWGMAILFVLFAGEGEDVVAAIRRYAADSAARRWIGGEEEHGRLLHALGETDPQPGRQVVQR